MEKLKDIKIKHNHTLTDILKIIIFALVMLAPFGAVLSKTLYTTFNKNAKDSYSGNYEITYKYESNEVNSLDDLVNGNIYEFYAGEYGIEDICPNIDDKTTFEIITPLELNRLFIGGYNETLAPSTLGVNLIVSLLNEEDVGYMIYLYFSYEDYNEDNYVSFDYNGVFMHNCIVKLIYNETSQFAQYGYTNYNEIESVNLTGTLDNSFYYAVNELSDQPLFSWTKNTFIYSTINQMTTGLDFGNNNVLALLLTYWILNTMIYIIFDIIIEIFKKLTHAFN